MRHVTHMNGARYTSAVNTGMPYTTNQTKGARSCRAPIRTGPLTRGSSISVTLPYLSILGSVNLSFYDAALYTCIHGRPGQHHDGFFLLQIVWGRRSRT